MFHLDVPSDILWWMEVNTVGKEYFETDLAYTAGFLDADGAIVACIEKHKEKKFGFRIRVSVKVTQKDDKVLKWMRKIFCVGKIRANRIGTSLQTYDWIIRDQGDCELFLKVLEPYLKTKTKQASLALRILSRQIRTQSDLLYVAKTADALSGFNVRSKNRRKNHMLMIQEYFSRND